VDQLAGGASEVPTGELGLAVLQALRPLDMVAYIRFASVYREVQDADDFVDLLQPWMKASE
jgi:transcriptional repressor NrdR